VRGCGTDGERGRYRIQKEETGYILATETDAAQPRNAVDPSPSLAPLGRMTRD